MYLVPHVSPDMRAQAGFSLIEILIVVALVGVLAGIAAPTVTAGMKLYTINSAGQQVTSTIRAARFQAVGKNTKLRVRFNYPAAGQYQVVLNSNGTTAVGDVQNLPDGVSFGASADVQIDTNGRMTPGATAATITVTNGNESQNRTITVSTSMRVQL